MHGCLPDSRDPFELLHIINRVSDEKQRSAAGMWVMDCAPFSKEEQHVRDPPRHRAQALEGKAGVVEMCLLVLMNKGLEKNPHPIRNENKAVYTSKGAIKCELHCSAWPNCMRLAELSRAAPGKASFQTDQARFLEDLLQQQCHVRGGIEVSIAVYVTNRSGWIKQETFLLLFLLLITRKSLQ